MEEQFCQVGDARLGVLEAECHLADLTFHLYHVVENEVGERCHGVLADQRRAVSEPV